MRSKSIFMFLLILSAVICQAAGCVWWSRSAEQSFQATSVNDLAGPVTHTIWEYPEPPLP